MVVEFLSHVRLFATSWTAARRASLSVTISQSLLKFMSVESMMPSNISSFIAPFSCSHSFLASGSLPRSQLFTSAGQSIGVSALASVLRMNIQGWFPSGLTALISLQSKVRKCQFFGSCCSAFLWFNSHIHTWPLEKPKLCLDVLLSARWCLCFLICYVDLP